MHPAYSVILFTTASGAGYGLLIWLALAAALGLVPVTTELGLVGLGSALMLVTGGLMSSTFHLGRPERAWRALSQWRSSWLSREGVLAMLTYVPAAMLGIGWVFLERSDGPFRIAAVATIVLALATLWCTGMIYGSLKTIRAWSQPLVAPIYIVLALATGAVLATLLLAIFGLAYGPFALFAVAGLAISAVLKTIYWRAIDGAGRTLTPGAATGLGRLGTVRPLEPAHSQPNFLMREMGYQVARKHAEKLRRFAGLSGVVVPAATLVSSLLVPWPLALLLAIAATLGAATGVIVERWLFFAEAQHVVTLYYGAEAA